MAIPSARTDVSGGFFRRAARKIREDAVVHNKAIYLALGILPDGTRDILDLWIEGTEGAKF
ncbi:transposase [Burkholderia thailandensis E264]|uniref:Transposase n=1 Tax=Burkholderia thailandensis (strain ATCC 700388 / DSM 13276 / CCUG 48851 / CIP 106301 / E264) TaxID=271848 RepID=Q2T8M8_BURTA|nr:transposase [Burkholderia thailandensis E264]